MKYKKFMIFALLLVFVVTAGAEDNDKESKADSITIEELRDHMYFLASDFLGGRVTDTMGYNVASEYVASQFRAAGLKPLYKDDDGNDTYFQKVPLMRKMVVPRTPFTLKTAAGEKPYEIGELIKLFMVSDPEALSKSTPLVFVGYGIEEPSHGWNDYESLDLEGKIAVYMAGTPHRDGKPVLPGDVNSRYTSFRGVYRKLRPMFNKKVVGAIVIADSEMSGYWNQLPDTSSSARYSYIEKEKSTGRHGFFARRGNVAMIRGEVVSSLFAGQPFNPSGEFALDDYKTFDMAGTTIHVEMENDEGVIYTRNVVAMVEGTDPELKDRYVVVGAHLDHVPPQGGLVSNGADDNASGSIGVIEVAEAVAMNPPRASVVFVLYVGEEKGLLGSRYFVENSPVSFDNIMTNINLDMIGRTSAQHKQDRAHYVVGSDKATPELQAIIDGVNKRTVNWPLDFKGAEMFMRNSDHWNFHTRGKPVAFFFSGIHPDLHRPTDDAEKIDYEKMQAISQLVYEVTMELSNRDEPLKKLDLDEM